MLTENDTTIGIRFGMQAIMAISAEDAIVSTTDTFTNISQITQMAWYGYRNWCLWMDEKPQMNKQQFVEFLDVVFLNNNTIFADIVKCFEEGQTMENLKNSEKKIQEKKKSAMKIS